MAPDVKEWQHVHPVGDHVADPPVQYHNVIESLYVWQRAKCRKCRRAIVVFPVGAGPESLKALMKLR